MRTVSTYSLRDNLADYLGEVERTEVSLAISRFGKPIAIISPYKKEVIPSYKNFFGFLKKGLSGEKFLAKTRRSAKEKKLTSRFRSK